MLTLRTLSINADILKKKMVSNHLLFSLILHAIFKANSQSTPLILCNLNPESTNSKQE